MADVEFSYERDGYGRDTFEETGSSAVTLTNVAGALVSLALIAGVGVWGYDLMLRDVSGIPVVRAAAGEMRVRPENPGGELARHQGLAVNEIAARGGASGPVDQVVLAPPAVALAAEDQPVIQQVEPITQPPALAPAGAATLSVDQDKTAVTQTSTPFLEKEIDAVVADLISADKSAEDTPKPIQARATLTPQPAVLRAVLDAPGIRVSARPRLRPAEVSPRARQVVFSPPSDTPEIDPEAIPAGTRLAQLGAFDSADVARAEWQRMQTRFGEILLGKSRVVQQAQSGGRTFYRLRAMGFVDLSDARRFCSAVKAEGVDCIPVQVK